MNVNIETLRDAVPRLMHLSSRLDDVIAQLEDSSNCLQASGNQYDAVLRALYDQRKRLEERMSTLRTMARVLDNAADQYDACERQLIENAQALRTVSFQGSAAAVSHLSGDFLNGVPLTPNQLPLERNLPLRQRRLFPSAGEIIPATDIREALNTFCPLSAE